MGGMCHKNSYNKRNDKPEASKGYFSKVFHGGKSFLGLLVSTRQEYNSFCKQKLLLQISPRLWPHVVFRF